MAKLRILLQSECAAFTTGMGVVSYNLLSRLHKDPDFDVCQLALSHLGHPSAANKVDFPMYPVKKEGNGEEVMLPILKEFRPHIVIAFGDPWMSEFMFGTTTQYDQSIRFIPQEVRKKIKFVTYYPIDGIRLGHPAIKQEWAEQMRIADMAVFCTKFAEKATKSVVNTIRSEMIPHGVDTKAFFPEDPEKIKQFKSQFFQVSDVKDPFVVGMVARNQARKDYPQLFQAIQIASKTMPNLYCYCHCIINDQGWDLANLAHQYGIRDRVIFNGKIQVPNQGIDIDQLRLIYNSLDIFILATQGEGFGLPVLEAMSCGVPVLTTDYAASAELVRESGGGELIKAEQLYYRGYDHNIRRPITSGQDLADKIINLSKDPQKRKQYGDLGRKYAESLDWDKMVDRWKVLLKGVMFPPEGKTLVARHVF